MASQLLRIFHLRKLDRMEYAGLLTIAAAGIFSFVFTQQEGYRPWLIAPILLAFVAMHVLHPDETRSTGNLRHARIAFMVLLALGMYWATGDTFGGMLLFFIMSATVAFLFPTRTAFLWIALFGVMTIVANWLLWGDFWPALTVGLSTLGGYSFFGAAANAQRRAETANAESKRLLDELQSAYQQLEAHAEQAEQLAASEERNRLAREVHDTLGHRLTVAAVQLEGAQRLVHDNPDKAAQMVTTVREQVLDGLTELRSTVAALRAPLAGDASLTSAITRLVSNFQEATGIPVELTVDDDMPVLSDAQRHALYRAAQESLTNIQRHAAAKQAWVRLERCNNSVQLSVEDNGVGLTQTETRRGFGLNGLQERAVQVGGWFEISERADGGVRTSFVVSPISTDHHSSPSLQ